MPIDLPLEPIIWSKEREVPAGFTIISTESDSSTTPKVSPPPTNIDLPATLDELGISKNEQPNLLQNFLKSVCILFFLCLYILTNYLI